MSGKIDHFGAGGAQTLLKGLAILELFRDHPTLGNAEIAVHLGMPRSSAARLTATLEKAGYLTYDAVTARYAPGLQILTIAHPVLARFGVRQVARPLMQDLANSLRGTVSLGLLHRDEAVYIETARASEVEGWSPDIGTRLTLQGSAMGIALLACRNEAQDVLWDEDVAQAIRLCRSRGFSISRGGTRPEIHGVGVALTGLVPEHPDLALNCSLPAYRLAPGELEDHLGPRLVALAAAVQARMQPPR